MVVVGLIALGALIGLLLATAIRRWPGLDPSAPRLPSADVQATVRRHSWLRTRLNSRMDPTTATGLALTVAVLILVAASTALGVLAAIARTRSGLTHFDTHVTSWAAHHVAKSGGSTRALRFITQFGGALVVV
ncbi:MAG: hypothetical protein JWL70_1113, partial [Acidimicrobiia bacterium]|nr:hypothetical protein [Acidimicrobiia bacterium]